MLQLPALAVHTPAVMVLAPALTVQTSAVVVVVPALTVRGPAVTRQFRTSGAGTAGGGASGVGPDPEGAGPGLMAQVRAMAVWCSAVLGSSGVVVPSQRCPPPGASVWP